MNSVYVKSNEVISYFPKFWKVGHLEDQWAGMLTRPQPHEAEAEATTHEAEAEATTHEAEAEAEAEAKTHLEILLIII